jgi:flagellar hook-length control protein FliK
MNASRIEIATTLPEPDFEDESTLVSARQVVPLDRAKTEDRRRKVLTLLPLLLAATLCGALGAIAVNHFDRRENISSAASQPVTTNTQAAQASPAQASIASSEIKPRAADESSDTLPKPEETSGTSTEANAADNQTTSTKSEETVRKKITSPEPRQLVRPRRVQAAKPEPAKRTDATKPGAGRIQDIFGGPNP